MPELFRRVAAVTVGTLRFTNLDFAFTVTKDLSREPNIAEVQVYNLSESSRRQVEQTEDQQVRIEAGYSSQGGSSVIFQGTLRKASSQRIGADVITKIEAGDGERSMRRARINRSFGSGTSLRTVVEAVGESMGVGAGNLAEVAQGVGFEGLGLVFSEGTVVSGDARREMNGLLESAGVEWSVQDGNLQLLNRGETLTSTAVVLRADTGLVESPSIDSEGVMRARALLIPGVFPGRRVEVLSEFVRGFYRVEKAVYSGDTSATEWYVEIEARVPRA